jgi:sterol O-acyltransferase
MRAYFVFLRPIKPIEAYLSLSGQDPFRGFYTLFWILLAIMTLRTFEQSYQQSGFVVGTRFATLFSQDAKVLALSDLVLVGSTFLCVPFAKVRHRCTDQGPRLSSHSFCSMAISAITGLASSSSTSLRPST